MTRFRYPAAIAVTALLALIGSASLASQGGWLVVIPLVPLAAIVWFWRAGTDVNTYGIRVRYVVANKIVTWDQVEALVPRSGRRAVVAWLTNGKTVTLTAVKPADLPRIMAASGKTPATP